MGHFLKAFWPCHKKWQFFWRNFREENFFFDIFLLFKDFFGIFLIRQLANRDLRIANQCESAKKAASLRVRECEFDSHPSLHVLHMQTHTL